MKFYDDELECECCGAILEAGDTYYEHEGNIYCSTDCLLENINYKEKTVMSAYEKSLAYGDYLYDAIED